MLRSRPQPRPGFTIVELMVAAAVCVVIMTIMAACFQIGIDTMRHLRATGDMADQLRSATTVLRRDLAGDQSQPTEHFLSESGKPNGGVLVSNQRLDLFDPTTKTGWAAPRGGFFRVRSFKGTFEGDDGQVASYRGDGVGPAGNLLHFTAALSGKSDADFYYAAVTDLSTNQLKTYRSRAAEIAYFLDPNPRGKTAAGLNTYQLVRRQRLVAKTDAEKALLPSGSNSNPAMRKDEPSVIALKLNTAGTALEPCSMADLAAEPTLRLGGLNGVPVAVTEPGATDSSLAPVFQATTRIGDDVLASNVLSFEVRLIWTAGAGEPAPRGFGPPPFEPPGANNNSDSPADSLQQASQAAGQNPVKVEFDTRIDSGTGKPPLAARVTAVRVQLRVWDPKLQTARQSVLLLEL